MSSRDVGITFSSGCNIAHGEGANVEKPFQDFDLTMHELSPSSGKGYRGQLGFIHFTTEYRLPRHIHVSIDKTKFIEERIMILHGVGLVEITGEYFAVAPGSLVTTLGGVPHTFTACPAGVKLPDGTVSTGTFTMVYEYEEPTTFFPTQSAKVASDPAQYQPWEGSLEDIRFPKMTAEEVVEEGHVVFGKQQQKLSLACSQHVIQNLFMVAISSFYQCWTLRRRAWVSLYGYISVSIAAPCPL